MKNKINNLDVGKNKMKVSLELMFVVGAIVFVVFFTWVTLFSGFHVAPSQVGTVFMTMGVSVIVLIFFINRLMQPKILEGGIRSLFLRKS